jgi:phage gp29-like protein
MMLAGAANVDAPQRPQTPTPNKSEIAKVYREYPISNLVTRDWSVDGVQNIVQQHERGQFNTSAQLIDAMGQDDRIESALDTLILGVLRLPFGLVPSQKNARATGPTSNAEKAKEFVSDLWAKAMPESILYDWIRWAIMGGVGLAEVVWEMTEDEWKPVGLKVWHLQHVYWREDILRYVVMTAEGTVVVEPGNGKWLLLTPGGLRGHMRGAVRSIWRWWILRDFVSRDWARHSETLGKGILKAHIPSQADEPDKDRFVNSLRTMGTDGIVELAENGEAKFDLDLLEAEFDHGEAFEKLMLRCEANIAVRLLGQNATSENQGQYVARGVFSKVTLDRIDGIVGPVETCIEEQLCRPICEFNFDDADLAPSAKWDAEPPPDKLALANTLLNLGQFLLNATNGGYRVDVKQLSDRFGVTLVEAELPALQLARVQQTKPAATATTPDATQSTEQRAA